MALFPETMPRPVPTMDDGGFWAGCREKRLRFQACAECGTVRHPPVPVCPHCRSTKVAWRDAPREAEIFTYTVVHHASHPAVKERLPYVGAVVVFDEIPGVRLVTNIVGCDPADIRIGLKVKLCWDDIGDGMFLPRFRPAGETAS